MDFTRVPLADALFVLAHRSDGKRLVQRKFLKIGLAGAMLTDLVLHRRVALVDGKVVPDDAGVVVVGLLGEYDEMVRSEDRPRSAKHWVRKFRGSDVEGQVATRLRGNGLATVKDTIVLGFIPTIRCVPDRATLDGLTAHLTDTLTQRSKVTEWDASLVGLCDASGVLRKLLPGTPKSSVEAITEGEWASDAVRKVIRQANAAVRNAIISTVNANNGSQGF